MNIQEGQKAPQFSLPDQEGQQRNLNDYKGKWVLLYFYPKDDTPGCTVEACSLRDNLPQFKGINAEILGVSTDTVESHKEFEQKYGLPFTLLADSEKRVVDLYGVQGLLGTKRSSFLINPEGLIVKIYESVDPNTHTEQVFNDLQAQVLK